MDGAAVIKRLRRRDGWQLARSSRSHAQFTHPNRPGRVTAPHLQRDIPIGTLRDIYRQAGWPWKGRP
jgi:predicted RNA binding protein YcfA (HicA-like mRNA interferase family)